MVNDVYLRGEFPPPGRARARRTGNTPTDQYRNCLSEFSEAVERLQNAFTAVGLINGDDGRPLVEARGEEPRSCDHWRGVLRNIDDELIIWGRTFKKAYGTKAEPRPDDLNADDDELDSDENDPEEDDDLDGDEAGEADSSVMTR
jgi:hypothetical protein